MQNNILTINTDGGSRGNPGPAACAFVVGLDGKVLAEGSKYLGVATNNIAEYEGVLLATNWILENKTKIADREILFLLDSELVVKQVSGIYKIKKSELQTLSLLIHKNINTAGIKIYFKNIPREQNKAADRLVNEELDRH